MPHFYSCYVSFRIYLGIHLTMLWFGFFPAEPEGSGLIEVLATAGSVVLLVLTLPIAIFFCFKVSAVPNYNLIPTIL